MNATASRVAHVVATFRRGENTPQTPIAGAKNRLLYSIATLERAALVRSGRFVARPASSTESRGLSCVFDRY
jgi:hypothetical protein